MSALNLAQSCFIPHLTEQLVHRRDGELTCVLLTDLLAGFRRPLAAEVLDPLRGGVGLVVEGELGRIQPIGDVQEAAHAHHKTAS